MSRTDGVYVDGRLENRALPGRKVGGVYSSIEIWIDGQALGVVYVPAIKRWDPNAPAPTGKGGDYVYQLDEDEMLRKALALGRVYELQVFDSTDPIVDKQPRSPDPKS